MLLGRAPTAFALPQLTELLWIVVPRTFPTRLREMRMPTRDVLDVDADHPVLFDASYVWIVNSLALQMNHIDRNTPNPDGGKLALPMPVADGAD